MKFPYLLKSKSTPQADQQLPTPADPPDPSSTPSGSEKENADIISRTSSSKSKASHTSKTQNEKVVETTPVEEAAAIDKLDDDDEANYPHGIKLGIIVASLCLSIFLMALDNTIIATGQYNFRSSDATVEISNASIMDHHVWKYCTSHYSDTDLEIF